MKKSILGILILFSLLATQTQAEVYLAGATGNIKATKTTDATLSFHNETIKASTTIICSLKLHNQVRSLELANWTITEITPCRPNLRAHIDIIEELPPSFFEKIKWPINFCSVGICDVLANGGAELIFDKDAVLANDLVKSYYIQDYLEERNKLLENLDAKYKLDSFSEELFELEKKLNK
jgi:hypothetical protein